MDSVFLVTDAIWGGFSVPCGVNPDRVSFELPSPSAGVPSVQKSRKQESKWRNFLNFLEPKPEKRLDLWEFLSSAHLAVRRPDFP